MNNPKVNILIKTVSEGMFEYDDCQALHQHHGLVVVTDDGMTHTHPWINIVFVSAERVTGEETSVH